MPRGVYQRKKPAGMIPQAVRARPRDVRDMDRAELESYARELGLLSRALELPDDRLRQNIQAFLAEQYE